VRRDGKISQDAITATRARSENKDSSSFRGIEDDLKEALEQQSATSEILRVISSSPKDLQPVFDTIAERAARLCGAKFCHVFGFDGELLHFVAHHRLEREGVEAVRRAFPSPPTRGSVAGRAVLSGAVEQIPDVLQDAEYVFTATLVGKDLPYRSLVAVPMLLEGMPVGAIALARVPPGHFPERHINVLQTFAGQAVIAIENVRLFNEVDTRNRELTEALDRQTATSNILRIISRSRTDIQPVFDTIAESAARLCNAQFCFVYRFDGTLINFIAHYGAAPEGVEAVRRAFPRPPDRGSASGRSILSGAIEEIPDIHLDPEYVLDALADTVTFRSTVSVPMMMQDGLPIGIISIARSEPGSLPKPQIQALQIFADQAVIAVENIRLLQELEERTRDLTRSVGQLQALAEVGQAVSATLHFATVLDIIVSRAVALSGSHSGIVYEFDQTAQVFRAKATHRITLDHLDALRTTPIRLGEGAIGRAGLTLEAVEITDIDASGQFVAPQVREILIREGVRAVLAIPLVREGELLGGLVILRRQPGAISTSVVSTLQTFAAQSVLAIHNARLFEKLETRTEELSRSLSDLRAAQSRLIQTEKLASLGQLTAGIAHEIKNPLNFVNNFSSLSIELLDELARALEKLANGPDARAEIDEITAVLRGNLQKIVQHGKRADSIVKNMLLHSRQGSGEHRPVDINGIVEESLNLAYHGARAEKPGFNVTLERSLDPEAGDVDIFPQEITRVLLNLISNSFYAATKKKEKAAGARYEPTVTATTRNLGERIEIRIRDNGIGIPQEVKDKMFNPFFTTKPAGEGTGLGLSLSHDIIVKQHAGTIEVETEPGEYTEFRIVLLRDAAALGESEGRA
jgi:GAF domain-containing protein